MSITKSRMLVILWGVFSVLGIMAGPSVNATPSTLSYKADQIIVKKARRRMWLLREGVSFREYPIALGFNPLGHKVHQGDGRTPEGHYTITYKNAQSRFHLSLRVSYPSEQDRLLARDLGVSPGGDIMIHGLPNGVSEADTHHSMTDWTDGCIAVANAHMREIWDLVDVGTEILILP